jgi:hypothetical protein
MTKFKTPRKQRPALSTRSQDIANRPLRQRSQSARKHPPDSQQRINAFELLRLRRHGDTWKDAEEQAHITRRIAKRIFPRAFFADERGQVQAREYDPYTRRMKIPTRNPGEFTWLSVRGSHKASLVAHWNNALKAAGRGDFSLIDAFPKNVLVGGVRLPTGHKEVTRIVSAASESDKPFEDIYALAGTA